jgi:hypothetical protein
MKIQMFLFATIIVLLCFVGCSTRPPEKQELGFRYKFEKGKVYKYSTTMENSTSGQMMGQEFTVTSSANFDYSLMLTTVNNGIISLTTTFDRFDLKLNMPMMGFNDSIIVMKEYIGKRVKVTLSEQGKTLSVEPIDTIPPSRLQMMANLTPTELFRYFVLEIPEKKLDTNVVWKKDTPDTTMRSGMKMVTKNNIDFKVVGRENKKEYQCWNISLNGTSTIEGSGSQRGNDVTIDGSIKVNGSVYIAPKEGIFVFSEQANVMDMTTTVSGAQTGASTMAINTKIKTELVK